MKKLILFCFLMMLSTFVNAAYYVEIGNQMRITFSDGLQTAVVVNQKSDLTFRYRLIDQEKDNIDDAGRPSAYFDYRDERCVQREKCAYENMLVSFYTDKTGGALISLIDNTTHKISWHAFVESNKITKD